MKSSAMIDQIRQMHQDGHRIRKISRALGISRNTVKRYLKLQLPEGAGEEFGANQAQNWLEMLDWEPILAERRKGVTAKQLYSEHSPAISYSRFCRHLKERLKTPEKPAIPLSHEPGEKAQVDFADGIKIIDPKTGALRKTHLFCGVLPFSSYTYGEFLLDQKLPNFIRAHERMWAYFGGVTPYVIVDNLKAGVKKAHRYDPEVNPTYCNYGNHAGFAVLPARPRTPRDKAAVEAAIGVIQKSFYQQVRESKFYSLDELNATFRRFLNELNQNIMPDHGVSRADRFSVEKDRLLPLPTRLYELAEWRSAKVHPDSCIQIQKAIYSVPYQLIGRSVRVKVTDKLVEVFDEQTTQVACHPKKKPFESSFVEAHLPPRRMQSDAFELKKAKAKAEAIGPHMTQLIDELFSGDRPLQNLRRVQGMLRLWERGTKSEAMEYAAKQALQFHRFRLHYFKQCAERFDATGGRLTIAGAPRRDPASIHLHGG